MRTTQILNPVAQNVLYFFDEFIKIIFFSVNKSKHSCTYYTYIYLLPFLTNVPSFLFLLFFNTEKKNIM